MKKSVLISYLYYLFVISPPLMDKLVETAYDVTTG